MIPLFRAVRILAAAEVVSDKPSQEYHVRRICRSYSERFATPLHQVEELPILRVVQHYFEDLYERRNAGDAQERHEFLEEVRMLSLTPEEFAKVLTGPDRSAAAVEEFFKQAMEEGGVEKLFTVVPEELRAAPPPPPEVAEPAEVDLTFDDEPPVRT